MDAVFLIRMATNGMCSITGNRSCYHRNKTHLTHHNSNHTPTHSTMSKMKPTTVDEYIDVAPKEAQEKLRELRAILKEVVPVAVEKLKWGSPVFEEKRILFAYTAFKSHLNFFPTGPALEPFREELAKYKTGKESIQLPYDKPLPVELIRKIAEYRAKDVRENDARWMY